MPHHLIRPRLALAMALCAAVLSTSGLSDAQAAPRRAHKATLPPASTDFHPASHASLDLAMGKGQLIALPKPAASVLVANPDIADVQTPSPSRLFILGKASGTTTIYAIDAEDKIILQQDIRVRQNTDEIAKALKAQFPQYAITLDPSPGTMAVSGQVENAKDASDIMKTVEQYLGEKEKTVNRLSINQPTQVNLRVRVVEVSRQITQELGFNLETLTNLGAFKFDVLTGRSFYDTTTSTWSSSSTGAWSIGGGFHNSHSTALGLLDAMDQEGLVTTLAEPNLTAVSGQTASFLVGGEFPVPVAHGNTTTDNTVTVEFKPFGIALDFTPTVLSRDRISLKLRPEVSALSSSNGVTFDGYTIPGLTVRRLETTVELGSGQTFAVGGLLQSDIRDQVQKFPGLADLPVLGQLFRSTSFNNNETELVVLVTPYVVHPAQPQTLKTPWDALRPASDIEYVFHRRIGLAPGEEASEPRLHGPAGFMY